MMGEFEAQREMGKYIVPALASPPSTLRKASGADLSKLVVKLQSPSGGRLPLSSIPTEPTLPRLRDIGR